MQSSPSSPSSSPSPSSSRSPSSSSNDSSSSSSDEFEDAQDQLGPLPDVCTHSTLLYNTTISLCDNSSNSAAAAAATSTAISSSTTTTTTTTTTSAAGVLHLLLLDSSSPRGLNEEIERRRRRSTEMAHNNNNILQQQQQPSTSTAHHQHPNTLSPPPQFAKAADITSSSRRGRLNVLRGRMRTEFGSTAIGGGGGDSLGGGGTGAGAAGSLEVENSGGSTSESASLASWGRNLLMDHSTLNVGPFFPADSLSTKAAAFSTTNLTTTTTLLATENIPASENASATSSRRISVETSIVQPKSAALPPPGRRPPPLPLSPCPPCTSRIQIPPPNAVPPPLPPRNPCLRLPDAIPPQQINPFVSETSTENASSPVQSAKNDAEPAAQTVQSQTTTTSICSSSSNGYARHRGHVKTNSLDRGLSLAKTMKTGPFPPPSNKSNSLKRECSAADTTNDVNSLLSLDGGEEDLRNSDAQGIIHQITSSILVDEPLKEESLSSDSPYRAFHNHNNDARLSAVGEEQMSAAAAITATTTTTTTTTTPTASVVSPSSITTIKHDNNNTTEDHSSSRQQQQQHQQQKLTTTTTTTITEIEHLRDITTMTEHLSVDVSQTKTEEKAKEKEDNTMDIEQQNDETITVHHNSATSSSQQQQQQQQIFIDPITRDVERRMSMKGHQQQHTADKGNDQEGSSLQTSTTGGIERAALLMREYGSYASGFFRGAFSRARSVVTSSSAASKLPKEEDESCNESEKEETGGIVDNTTIVRPKSAKKGPFDFDGTRLVQELNNEHTGAVWCMRFSLCGRLLATAGQDNIIRVWVLRNHLAYFNAMRERYNSQQSKKSSTVSLGDNLLQKAMQQIEDDFRSSSTTLGESLELSECRDEESSATGAENCAVMASKPLCTYRGHTADVLDLSWSRNYFILSSGMDRTVKLWHLSRPECLCCFQHMDFVTCIAFMPKDDRYFLSGSLDGKLRLWHIPDKKVALWNEVEQVKFITAIAFVKNGRFAVIGTYDGRCFFYTTDQLKYHTVIDVRSSRGKNARGHKVTGLAAHGDKLLVTSNDSRIRMYDLRDMALTCKFKGAQNERSQIRASFSPDGKHIVCGSEDRYVYVWTTADLPSSLSVRKDRNDSWQRIRCHSACVSAAIFAPRPQLFLSLLEQRRGGAEERRCETTSVAHLKSAQERQLHGDVIISADLTGSIKILVNRTRIKAGSSNFFTTADIIS